MSYRASDLHWVGNDLCCFGSTRALASIVQDDRYPSMWRARIGNSGKLSDMVNKLRAKDAAVAGALAVLNFPGSLRNEAGARNRRRAA